MTKKTKIVSIDIEVKGGTKVHLPLAEAKELYEQLDELFGKETEYVWHEAPWRRWDYPRWTVGDNTTTLPGDNTWRTRITYNSDSITNDA